MSNYAKSFTIDPIVGDYYVVTAQNSYGESGPSNTAQAMEDCGRNCWCASGQFGRAGARRGYIARSSVKRPLAKPAPQTTSPLSVTVITYAYDLLGRLTNASYTGALSGTYSYSYDAVGNRLSFSTNVTNTQTVTYTYDAANRLVMATRNGQPWYYEYDGNGNQTRQVPDGLTPAAGEIRYTFNQRNQLVLIETHDGNSYQPEASAAYDGAGNRLQTAAYISGVPITINYTVDVQQYGRPLVQHNATITDTYLIPGLGEYQDNWRYYLTDAQMSVRQLVDGNGDLILSRTYDPFGSVINSSGAGNAVFGFVGAEEGGMGLWYGDGRYYDPAAGRFLSPDYNNFDPMRPGTLNGYLASLLLANPGGLFFGPLLLVNWRRRKKNGKYPSIWLLIAGVGLGVFLSSCQSSPGASSPGTPPITQPVNPTVPSNPVLPPTQPPPATPVGPPSTPAPVPTAISLPDPTVTPAPFVPPPKANQYDWYALFGGNACGLVAGATGFAQPGTNDYADIVQAIRDASGNDYGNDTGIQPPQYARALQEVYGADKVNAHSNWTIDQLATELAQGNVVIVDILVGQSSEHPDPPYPVEGENTIAHFARVLYIDYKQEIIYLENTLANYPQSYWEVSFERFEIIWEYPEVRATSGPPEEMRDRNATKWAVVIQGNAIPRLP